MFARHTTITAAAAALALFGLTACTGGGAPSTSGKGAVAPTSANRSGAGVVRTVLVNKQKVTFEVGPVRVQDGVGVLAIRAVGVDHSQDADGVSLGVEMNHPFVSGVGPSAVRLVDPAARTVSTVATDTVGSAVMSNDLGSLSDGPVKMYAAFAAPTGDTVGALLPGVGYFGGVPVVKSGNGSGPDPVKLADLTKTAAQALKRPVIALDSLTAAQGGAVRTRTEAKEVTVVVATDVLFATGSAGLGPQADAALRSAGSQIARYSAGALKIVGHTDDVAADGYNQALSVRRAQAVADRLATLGNVAQYKPVVVGRGESEPAVAGTSPEARAANRRVELKFTPAVTAKRVDEQPKPVGDLPPAKGPVGKGSVGVHLHRTVLDEDNEFLVTLAGVRRLGDMLVGELQVKRVSGGPGSMGYLLSSGAWGNRGGVDPQIQQAATNLTLLQGGTRYYALDYVRNDVDSHDPLADRFLSQYLNDGDVKTVTVVWPGVPGDTVTLDAPANVHTVGAAAVETGGPPFRLTDVPVVSR